MAITSEIVVDIRFDFAPALRDLEALRAAVAGLSAEPETEPAHSPRNPEHAVLHNLYHALLENDPLLHPAQDPALENALRLAAAMLGFHHTDNGWRCAICGVSH